MPKNEPANTSMICYLGLGSNIGDRKSYLDGAISALKKETDITLARISSFYDTAPVGNVNQGRFLNAVIEIETRLKPEKLLDIIMDIENELGRVRTERWGPRTIDIDILTFGDLVYETERLSIPHPLMHERMFVLKPLAELAPAFRHPVFGATAAEMLKECAEV